MTGLSHPCCFRFFSHRSICSTVAFPPLGNSDHVFVSISIDISSNSERNTLFCCTDYDYSHTDLNGLQNGANLGDVPS